MVALLGFLEAMQVVVESGLRLPGRAVDALQLGAPLVAAPVGGGDLGQLEMAEPARGGDVRAAAEVDELAVVAVGADHALASPLGGVDACDDLELVGLVGEELETLGGGVLLPGEGLVFGDDLPHPGLDAGQVVLAEVGAAGQLEVVVEAVLDRRPDGVVGARPEVGDRLGEHVGGGVAQDVAAGVRVRGDDLRRGRRRAGWRVRSVGAPSTSTATAVLARAAADRRGQVGAGRAGRQLPRRSRRAGRR